MRGWLALIPISFVGFYYWLVQVQEVKQKCSSPHAWQHSPHRSSGCGIPWGQLYKFPTRTHQPNTDQNPEQQQHWYGLITANLARRHPQEQHWCGADCPFHRQPQTAPHQHWEKKKAPMRQKTAAVPWPPGVQILADISSLCSKKTPLSLLLLVPRTPIK